MIENMNDVVSLIVIVLLVLGALVGAFKISRVFKKDEETDEYYRDLL